MVLLLYVTGVCDIYLTFWLQNPRKNFTMLFFQPGQVGVVPEGGGHRRLVLYVARGSYCRILTPICSPVEETRDSHSAGREKCIAVPYATGTHYRCSVEIQHILKFGVLNISLVTAGGGSPICHTRQNSAVRYLLSHWV